MPSKPYFIKTFLLIIIAFLVFLADKASKVWILHLHINHLLPQVILPVFNLTYVVNFGISFGIFSKYSQSQVAFVVLASLLILAMLYCMVHANNYFEQLLYSAIVGGASGNIHDRIVHGGVIDFLDFHYYQYHYPAFNVADSVIVTSIILLILLQLKRKPS
jgi:signal peptidase II